MLRVKDCNAPALAGNYSFCGYHRDATKTRKKQTSTMADDLMMMADLCLSSPSSSYSSSSDSDDDAPAIRADAGLDAMRFCADAYPLHAACVEGDEAAVRRHLREGADIEWPMGSLPRGAETMRGQGGQKCKNGTA